MRNRWLMKKDQQCNIELTNMNGDDDDDDELSWYIDNYEANPDKPPKSTFQAILEQLSIIIELGLPNCIEKFSSFFPGFMLLIFYGHLGSDEISGAGFGFMYGNGKHVYMS